VLRSRRSQWVLTIAVAVLVFGLLEVVLGGDSDDGSDRPRSSRRPSNRPLPPRPRPEGPQGLLKEHQAVERARRQSPWLTRGGARGRLVALTFDDGPGPITPTLLAELRRLNAPATFFQVATQAQMSPELADAEGERPFAAGSHTLSHARLPALRPAAQRAEIVGGARGVAELTGREPRLFRPPYGAYDDQTLRILRREKMLMVLWTFSAYDWKHPKAGYIARRVLRLARPGAIVLMHDGGGFTRAPTVKAMPRIVSGLRRRGYRLVTVPRLLREAPPDRRSPRPHSPYPG
jgi:peptidoglycan/xylan/chitin deacetylase (PgdA/CDA1 family)